MLDEARQSQRPSRFNHVSVNRYCPLESLPLYWLFSVSSSTRRQKRWSSDYNGAQGGDAGTIAEEMRKRKSACLSEAEPDRSIRIWQCGDTDSVAFRLVAKSDKAGTKRADAIR